MIAYQSGNSLIDSLPGSVLEGYRSALRMRELEAGQLLYAGLAQDEVKYVYFPVTAVTSMSTVLSDGDFVEALPVGYEGLAGFQVIFGSARILEQWICAVPGTVAQMSVTDFWRLLNSNAQWGRILLCYGQSLITALAVYVACNAKHSVFERSAKLLLQSHDRARTDEFPMTHEFLATMLGVRRAGVSTVAAELQRKGCISYVRGRMSITNRETLEQEACECYATITGEYLRLMALSRADARTGGDRLSFKA